MPELFNVHGFGPPGGITLPSTCPWVDHRSFASTPYDYTPFQDLVSLRLRQDLA